MEQHFDTTIDYVLENEKVLLRPITISDYENLLPFALNEPKLWKFSLVPADGAARMKTAQFDLVGTKFIFVLKNSWILHYYQSFCLRAY